MNESRFIKTVTFGGYDKNDVDKKLESLYTQVYDLKNELRETKLLIEEYKKGTDAEKAQETVIAGERAMLTSAQVQKETLSDKVKLLDDDRKSKEKEIEELKGQLSTVKAQLEEANSRLTVFEAGTDAASLGTVFIEAQKAANTVIETSKAKAEELEKNADKLVQNMVDDANNKASKIIYEAEKRAAEMDAESKNNSEKMNAASENLRAVVLNEVEQYSEQISKLRTVFENFEDMGIAKIQESEELLKRTRKKLADGGVPVFRDPAVIKAEIPPEPEYKKIDNDIADEKKEKKNEELDKLMAMAQAIGGDKPAEDKPSEKKEEKKGSVSLDDLMKQAASIS